MIPCFNTIILGYNGIIELEHIEYVSPNQKFPKGDLHNSKPVSDEDKRLEILNIL